MKNLKTILFEWSIKKQYFEYSVHYLLIPLKLHVKLLIYTAV